MGLFGDVTHAFHSAEHSFGGLIGGHGGLPGLPGGGGGTPDISKWLNVKVDTTPIFQGAESLFKNFGQGEKELMSRLAGSTSSMMDRMGGGAETLMKSGSQAITNTSNLMQELGGGIVHSTMQEAQDLQKLREQLFKTSEQALDAIGSIFKYLPYFLLSAGAFFLYSYTR